MAELKWHNIDGSNVNNALTNVLTATNSFGNSLTNLGNDLYTHTLKLQNNLRLQHEWEKDQNTQSIIMQMNQANNQEDINRLTEQGLVDPNQLWNQYGTKVDLSKIQEKQHSWLTDTYNRAKNADTLKDYTPASEQVQAEIQNAINNRDFAKAHALINNAVSSSLISKTTANSLLTTINTMTTPNKLAQMQELNKSAAENVKNIQSYYKHIKDTYHLNWVAEHRENVSHTLNKVNPEIIKHYVEWAKQGVSKEEILQKLTHKFGGDETLDPFLNTITGYEQDREAMFTVLNESVTKLNGYLRENPGFINTLSDGQISNLEAAGVRFGEQKDGSSIFPTYPANNQDTSQSFGSSNDIGTQGQLASNGQTPQVPAAESQAAQNALKGVQGNTNSVYPTTPQNRNQQQLAQTSANNVDGIDSKVKKVLETEYKYKNPNDLKERELAYNYLMLKEKLSDPNSTVTLRQVKEAKNRLDEHTAEAMKNNINLATSGSVEDQGKVVNLIQASIDNNNANLQDRINKVVYKDGPSNAENQLTNNAMVQKIDGMMANIDFASPDAFAKFEKVFIDEINKLAKKYSGDKQKQLDFIKTYMDVFQDFRAAVNTKSIIGADGKQVANPKFSDYAAFKNKQTTELAVHVAEQELENVATKNGIPSKFNKGLINAAMAYAGDDLASGEVELITQTGEPKKVSIEQFINNFEEMRKAANSGSAGIFVDLFDELGTTEFDKLSEILNKASTEKKYILVHTIADVLNPLIKKAYETGNKEDTKKGKDKEWANATQEVTDKLKGLVKVSNSLSDKNIEDIVVGVKEYKNKVDNATNNLYSGFSPTRQQIQDAREAQGKLHSNKGNRTLTQVLRGLGTEEAKAFLSKGEELAELAKAADAKLEQIDKAKKGTTASMYERARGYGRMLQEVEAYSEQTKKIKDFGEINTKAYREQINYIQTMISISKARNLDIKDLEKQIAIVEAKLKRAEAHNASVKNLNKENK